MPTQPDTVSATTAMEVHNQEADTSDTLGIHKDILNKNRDQLPSSFIMTSSDTDIVNKDSDDVESSSMMIASTLTKEVAHSMATPEEQKPSGESDENTQDVSKNLKFNPVKVVKEDLERKLRLSKQLKDLKVKETTLEGGQQQMPSTSINDVDASSMSNHEEHVRHVPNGCLNSLHVQQTRSVMI